MTLAGLAAPPLDEHPDLVIPPQVARDAAAIVDATIRDPAVPPGGAAAVPPGGTAGPSGATTVDAGLTEPQRAMLDFERRWWRQPGSKEQAIRDAFGMTPTRYYQALNGLLDLPAAMQYDAALVHRLQRVRAQATRGRRRLD